MLEKSLQNEAIGSSFVPRQGKSGLFWGSGVARTKKMKKAQKRRLFGYIVWAIQGAKMEILAKVNIALTHVILVAGIVQIVLMVRGH